MFYPYDVLFALCVVRTTYGGDRSEHKSSVLAQNATMWRNMWLSRSDAFARTIREKRGVRGIWGLINFILELLLADDRHLYEVPAGF